MTEVEHIAHAAQMESAAMAAREERLIAALREVRECLAPKGGGRLINATSHAISEIDAALRSVGEKP